MAELRTRKLKSEEKQASIAAPAPQMQYSFRASGVKATSKAAVDKSTDSLFRYDPKYIFSDIRRTAVIASLILLLLVLTKVVLVAKGIW
jgi:hypothetical protein